MLNKNADTNFALKFLYEIMEFKYINAYTVNDVYETLDLIYGIEMSEINGIYRSILTVYEENIDKKGKLTKEISNHEKRVNDLIKLIKKVSEQDL